MRAPGIEPAAAENAIAHLCQDGADGFGDLLGARRGPHATARADEQGIIEHDPQASERAAHG